MSSEHILQKAVGYISIGNAGLSSVDKHNGYVVVFCTVDADNRFVDIAVTRKQINDLKLKLEAEIL